METFAEEGGPIANYVIEKIDGKYICVNYDDQSVQDIITKIPEENVDLAQNFAQIKYNDYSLMLSRAAYGGLHLRTWTADGITTIEVADGPQKSGPYFVYVEWGLHGDDTYIRNSVGSMDFNRYETGKGYAGILGVTGLDITFNDLMKIIIKGYPFIDKE